MLVRQAKDRMLGCTPVTIASKSVKERRCRQSLLRPKPHVREYADAEKLLWPQWRCGDKYPELANKRDAGVEAVAKTRMMPRGRRSTVALYPTPNDGQIHTPYVAGNVYMSPATEPISPFRSDRWPFVADGAGKLSEKVISDWKAQLEADPVHRQHQLPS
jgi:hypothetical protein